MNPILLTSILVSAFILAGIAGVKYRYNQHAGDPYVKLAGLAIGLFLCLCVWEFIYVHIN